MAFTKEQYKEYAKSSPAVKRYRNSEKARLCRRRYRLSVKGQEKEKESLQRRKSSVRDVIEQAKNVPCADCGGRFDTVCMDFHHLRDKKFLIGRNRRCLRLVLLELEKCVVICANCHRLRHKSVPSR
jgi:hypothetical protein